MIGILVFALILSSGIFQNFISFAYEAQTGMIVTDEYMVETKDNPSDTANKVSGLVYGKPVTVIDEVTGEDGKIWYKITYKLKADPNAIKTAYVHKENVLLDKDVVPLANGSINANAVNLRDDAGTEGTLVIKVLNTGDRIEILGQTTVSGVMWYRVRHTIIIEPEKPEASETTETIDSESTETESTETETTETTELESTEIETTESETMDSDVSEEVENVEKIITIGWVKATYVNIDEYVYEPDLEFEEQMRLVGFPESYISYLSYLHSKYPEWLFVPVITGLDWNDVMANESVSNRNLVLLTTDDAKKSMADSEYNWQTNTWVPRDTGKWCTVHPDYLAYCMDPRNFLNESYVFMFEDLSYSETYNLDGVKAVVRNTFLAGEVIDTDGNLLNYAQAFMDIGKLVDVSPYHLAARVRQEHGAGNSVLISGTYPGYEGYFNFFNIGASGSNQQMVIQNGFNEAVTDGWTSRYLALVGGATKVAKNYISKGQDTLYFQKFNVVYQDKLYWHQYMQNVTAHMTESQSVARGYEDKHQAFVFRIPVYNNMPEEAVEFTAQGNRNNYLSSLEIEGLSLTPTFYGKTTSYSIVVDNAVSSITVSATPVVEKSTVTGTGAYNLEVGNNIIKVYCKSESGETLAYTITVSRLEAGVEGGDKFEEDTPDVDLPDNSEDTEGSESEGTESEGSESEGSESEGTESEDTETEEPVVETPEWSSEVYNVGNYITGIKPGTSATEFLGNFTSSNCQIRLLKADGSENTGTVATGNRIAVYFKGTLIATKDIVVYGDVNGDGAINMLDIIRVNRHIIGKITLQNTFLEAADANRKQDGVNMLDIIRINRHIIGKSTIEQAN